MFEDIHAASADPILGLADIFQADDRPGKINLGIGVYKDETGLTPIMACVKKAEQRLLEQEYTKNYLDIAGMPAFATLTQALLFGRDNPLIHQQRLHTAQTPGGTGAIRVASDFLAQHTKIRRVWISDPSWPNHHNIFKANGFEIKTYPYYDAKQHQLDFTAMLNALSEATPNDVVVLHGCCHNPTGIDPTFEQWQQLSQLALEKGWMPLFDLAYQGLGKGLEEDVAGLRLFAEEHPEILICSSYSKNFGLYNERTGAFTLQASDSKQSARAFSQVKAVIRASYSNPPAHGAAIVVTVLNDDVLRDIWMQELANVRQRIQRMRQLFVNTLAEKNVPCDFSFINQQNGMFSYSGLNAHQVERLSLEFGIYAISSGRINIAGMTPENMSRLCEAIKIVMED